MKPEYVFQKNTEETTNKMRIPKFIVEKWGRRFYMEIYSDHIVLKPVKE